VAVLRGVGDELVGQAAPGEAEPGADHRRVGDPPARELEQERRRGRDAEQAQHDVDRDAVDVVGVVARGERRDPDDAGDDRADREQLAPPRPLAQQPLAREQQHEQPGRERRLHDDERRIRERDDLQRPAEHRHAGSEQPARACHKVRQERDPQRVAVGRVASVERLDRDP